MTLSIEFGVATDVGLVRQVNEDACLAAAPVCVVADGMGGHQGGDVASRFVREAFTELAGRSFSRAEGRAAIRGALAATQRKLAGYAREQERRTGGPWRAGTTAVVGLLVDADETPVWLVANVGDSRAYVVDDAGLRQLSTDHSLVQRMVDEGKLTPDEAAHHPLRNVVTRALGSGPEPVPEPDFFVVPLTPGLRLMLCSDGVSGLLTGPEMEVALLDRGPAQPAARRLVVAALEKGGFDNASVVVADVVGWER